MKVRRASEKEWDNIYSNCPYSTFYHSIVWYKYWAKELNAKLCPLLFYNNEKSILLPLLKFKYKYFFSKLRGSPLGTYGYVLSSDIIDNELLIEINTILKKLNIYINITGNPYFGFNQKNDKNFTQIIDLKRPINEIEANIKKKQVLLEVKKSLGYRLQLKIIPHSDIYRLFEMYLKRRKQWENPTNMYSYETFEYFHSIENADYWGVYLRDYLIGGGIFFRHKSRVYYWIGVSDSDYLKYYPNKFLIYKLIQFYHQKNFETFDLNPSGGHQGVVKFKNSFGATQVFFDQYEYIPKKLDLVRHVFHSFLNSDIF